MFMDKLLRVNGLCTSFKIAGKFFAAVDDFCVDIYRNEVFAIVGESGSGKSAMALSLTKLHNPNYTRIEGEVIYDGRNLISMNETELNAIRGSHIGMIFQDSLFALNPLLQIGSQIEESLFYHSNLDKAERRARAMGLLEEVGIIRRAYSQLPHELSGGMRQRVMIAIAVACKPDLIIADEPTTALDVTIQSTILELLKKLQEDRAASIILITHDLGVVAEIADRVGVMYAGQLVEIAGVYDLFNNPMHPYTRSLLASMPRGESDRLSTISGSVPPLQNMPKYGCRFALRAPWIPERMHERNPKRHEISPGHFVMCTCYLWR